MGSFVEQFYRGPIRKQNFKAPKYRDAGDVFSGVRVQEIPLATPAGVARSRAATSDKGPVTHGGAGSAGGTTTTTTTPSGKG